MTFHVELTENAERNVDEILCYIVERSLRGATAWWNCWRDVVEDLSETADQKAFAPESEDHGEDIYHVIFKTRRGLPYRALFIIRDRTVFILHVRGPGQDLVSEDELKLPE